jgi:nucleotide-binding universal stress UspA family protein
MVHLRIGQPNTGLLKVTADLAARFHANVVGIGACQPIQMIYGDGYISGDVVQQDREEIERELKTAEAEFRSALGARVGNLEWRSSVTYVPLSDYLADEARCADLLITGVDPKLAAFDGTRHVNAGDLVMQAGRPLLIVPAAVDKVAFDRIIVGWKDTRETRRAIVDALPFLKAAREVTVVEVCAKEELALAAARLNDVVNWLGRHGVVAQPQAMPLASSDNDAGRLGVVARDKKADLIVGGAYGHSRLREWVLGGVTGDLLLQADRCSLVSH